MKYWKLYKSNGNRFEFKLTGGIPKNWVQIIWSDSVYVFFFRRYPGLKQFSVSFLLLKNGITWLIIPKSKPSDLLPQKAKVGPCCWPLIIMEWELVTGLEYTYMELDGDMFVKELAAVETKPGLARLVELSITSLIMWRCSNFGWSLYLYFAFNLRT